ncbi:MAG: murein transglycosylase A [Alphaproteobacteria bacterium]
MRKNVRWLTALALCLITACTETPKEKPVEKLILTPVTFEALPGWNADKLLEVLPALQRSCGVMLKKSPDQKLSSGGTPQDWVQPCQQLIAETPKNDQESRSFFERWFRPFAASTQAGDQGLFTGYYEAELRGSYQQTGIYQTPLYARPNDLIDVDLGEFKKDLKGQRIVGKVDGSKLKPYDERKTIAEGSLKERAKPLVYVSDPVDAFFLEVQGSGRVTLDHGDVLRLGYDGTNGRAYTAIGKAMADMQLLERPITMKDIRAWLKAHPLREQEIMNLNSSYIFFRVIEGEGPIGAMGLPLTPHRSMAVDPTHVALGTPLWLNIKDGEGAPLQKMVVAQDTGGAIKGAIRGDFFWGYGETAEKQAGSMQSQGQYYLLLPKSVIIDVEK